MQTTTQRCEHCGKTRDVAKQAVSIQRFEDGRYKSVRMLVCSDTCAPGVRCPPEHQNTAAPPAHSAAEANMVSLNARIQHKYDLTGGDFAPKRHPRQTPFYLLILPCAC